MNQKLKILNFTLLLLGALFFYQQSHAQTNCHIDDWTALKAIYNSTDGENWTNKDFWGQYIDQPGRPADCHLGKLDGITTVSGRVTRVVLIENNMNGTLPAGNIIQLLSNVRQFAIFNNPGLTGTLPLFRSMPNLLNLDLRSNNLYGVVPTNRLSNLTNLRYLRLDDNDFHGSLPDLGSLQGLRKIFLGSNEFTGGIPASYANLNLLTFINLAYNELSGSFPSALLSLCGQLFPAFQDYEADYYIGGGSNNFNQTWTQFCNATLPKYSGNVSDKDGFMTQNLPNPFSNATAIKYFIPENSVSAKLSIMDVTGRTVKTIEIEKAGSGVINFSADDLPLGIYTYTLYSNGEALATKKMIVGQQ